MQFKCFISKPGNFPKILEFWKQGYDILETVSHGILQTESHSIVQTEVAGIMQTGGVMESCKHRDMESCIQEIWNFENRRSHQIFKT